MAVKLIVKRNDQEGSPLEHAFEEQDLITIGRDASADLTLFDDQMLVSRLHARLERDGDSYFLSDLGSRNFTQFRGEQLVPGQPVQLQSGDVFHVANYEVRFERATEAQRDFGETRFEAGFINPFSAHMQTLLHVLTAMDVELEKLPEARKSPALEEALSEVEDRLKKSGVLPHLAASIRSESPEAASPVEHAPSPVPGQQAPGPSPSEEPAERTVGSLPPPVATGTATPAAPPVGPSMPAASSSTPAPAHAREAVRIPASSRARIDRLMDIFMDYLSRQVKVPWQFRYEFIGHTFIPTEDTRQIYESDVAGLTEFLFSQTCTPEEFERRLSLIDEALSEALGHQMALLDGYREAVGAGTRLMIEQLNPEHVKQALLEENVVFKYLPFLAAFKAWAIMLEKHGELEREDVSVLERRTYRPAFIKSYLERMTAIKEGGH